MIMFALACCDLRNMHFQVLDATLASDHQQRPFSYMHAMGQTPFTTPAAEPGTDLIDFQPQPAPRRTVPNAAAGDAPMPPISSIYPPLPSPLVDQQHHVSKVAVDAEFDSADSTRPMSLSTISVGGDQQQRSSSASSSAKSPSGAQDSKPAVPEKPARMVTSVTKL